MKESESVSHSVVSDSFWPPWTVALQTPLSMGSSRQEDWSGLPFPSPGDLSDPRIKPASSASPAFQVDSLSAEIPGDNFPSFLKIRFPWSTSSEMKLKDACSLEEKLWPT